MTVFHVKFALPSQLRLVIFNNLLSETDILFNEMEGILFHFMKTVINKMLSSGEIRAILSAKRLFLYSSRIIAAKIGIK